MKKLLVTLLTAVSLAFSAGAIAQPAPEPAKMEAKAEEAKAAPAPAAAPAAEAKKAEEPAADAPKPPNINKADTTFMYVATVLVIFMIIPGLALFYGGLVRQKNMLSVLMQVFVSFSLIAILWVVYGYSIAFTGGSPYIGGLDKLFLSGVTDATGAATFSKDTYIPEYMFVVFQLTFAAITPALIVGAFAERMKFSAVLLFLAIWFTFAYLPMAHMVWYWDGPDAITDEKTLEAVTASAGLLWGWGALDFAGGTVVHINAGIAGLVGAYMLGKRVGLGREPMPPHSLVFTMMGASMLWVGWFGFNVGSNLEANGVAGLAFLNTLIATAAAVLAWTFAEWMGKGKPSMLGAASGAVAGLVAITPAAGFVNPQGALIIGIIGGGAAYLGAVWLKRLLRYDDSLDAFGVHGVAGIAGALLTGALADPAINSLGEGASVMKQITGIGATVVWSAVATFVILMICKFTVGIRVSEEGEADGLDATLHGEALHE